MTCGKAEGYTDYPTFAATVKSKFGDVDLNQVISNPEKIHEVISLTQDDEYQLVDIETIANAASVPARA